MPKLTPNRVATWLTAASGAAAAIAVPVANLDPTDILPGLGAIAVAFTGWITGWQKHEARQALARQPTPVLGSGVTVTPLYSAATPPLYAANSAVTFTGGNSVPATPPDEDNSSLEAVDGDALAPTMPKIAGDE